MVTIGPYPFQASFFPEHLIIPLITLGIFLILLYVLAHIRTLRSLFTIEGLEASDFVAIFGLIIAIVSPLVIPFSQLPIIDYSVAPAPVSPGEEGDTQTIEITLHVYGVVAAKNVIVSMSANNVEFGAPTSTPFLANHLTYNVINSTAGADGGQIGKALVGIDALPARSHTIIRIPVVSQSSGTQSELSTYVQSDAAVSYYNTPYLFLFYGLLSITYLAIALILIKKHVDPLMADWPQFKDGKREKKGKVKLHRILEYGIFIFAGIAIATILLLIPYIPIGTYLQSILSFIGIVIIPLMVIITTLIAS